ncbi:hypothetical protein PV05_09076 [Exophiala xenobiotica]|uniref:Uncharacterized protein n=1 Tax=Exophiala xenobiotica TaxID=348802 RepID=A0A0D2EFZ7_9EURO|nr:uncharacterized protein PV05_09076 [Exophiala xenobiotica]KIW53510.1 hypothetical protein PV05_09076 [Exophiala xenobiotica]
MPVYLVHGFRWPREGFAGIRVHAIVHNLEDTSVEYIQNENSRSEILASFRKAYPEIMKELEGPGRKQLEFIEQYNPEDLDGPTAVSQPYAFVGDKVVMIAASPGLGLGLNGRAQQYTEADERQAQAQVSSATATTTTTSPTTSPSKKARATTQPMSKSAPFNSPADVTALSVNVEEVIADGPGLTNKAWEALADLRDKIAEGEKIGWWVVYNGDPERSYDEVDEDEEDEEEEEYYDEYYEQEDQQQVPQQQQQQLQQQRPVTSGGSSAGRPRTAPTSDSGRAESQSHPPLPLPISASSPRIPQQQPGLTALPIRPNMAEQQREPVASTGKPGKGKQKESIPEPAKLKETAKSQGLRKKFFGRRA